MSGSIALTGAHGFVGGHLLARLGARAIALDADVTDADSLAEAVAVASAESVVHLAEVKSEKVDCDSRQAYMTTRETSEVAATVLRSIALPKPQLTLYGASPLVEAKGGGTLVLQRLDVAGEREQVDLDGTQLKGKFFDFASADRALAPGGLYAATFKSSKVVFQVDPQAKPGATPIVGRLLRME